MDLQRWRQIEALYHAARERTPSGRSAFLADACRGDTDLRSEVESLLAQGAWEAGLLEHPAEETTPPARSVLASGAQLGPYKIVALLGAGGMGEVYDAFDLRLDRHVALKVLTGRAVAAGFRSRFVREARAAASLNHPHIAQIYEIGEACGTCYIAMEFIEGDTLRRKLNAQETPLSELLEYLRQAANALAKAHARGIIHCDLKPDNIMVTRDGFVKVLDFGLARLLHEYRREDSAGESQPRTTLPESSSGGIAGTPGYMSPEQAEGKGPLDQRSDVFSFGCLVFEAATRKLPFEGQSLARTMHNLLYEPAPRIADLCPGAPTALQGLVDRCLEKDCERRCNSMEEVGDLLRQVETGQAVPALPKPSARKRPAWGRWLGAVILAALVVVSGVMTYRRWQPARIPSVAVLPFINARNTAESEYLSDGLSESLINILAQLPDLKVIARSSSFRFRGEGDTRRAARSLDVQALVTGRVAEIDGRLRITAELVNGADGVQIWGAQYSPRISELADVQAEIARDIAERIRSHLTPRERARLAKETQAKPGAYEALLRGRYERQLYTPESRRKALGYYQQALAIDPGYALAHAELAYCYRLLSGSAILSAAEAMPAAEAEARRALAADEDLAEAHAALADIKKDQWDWAAAEREYRRALELNPNLTAAHQGFAIYLSVVGREEAAVAEIRRARELDPVGLPAAIHAAAVYYNARRYDQALDGLKRAAALDPAAPAAWTWTGIVNGGSGKFAAAIAAYEHAIALGDDTAATQCYYAYSLARAGRRDRALQILKRLQQPNEFVPPMGLAILHTGLNQRERAFQALQHAYASRDPLLQYLKVEPHLDLLSGDPRFQELARKIGLSR